MSIQIINITIATQDREKFPYPRPGLKMTDQAFIKGFYDGRMQAETGEHLPITDEGILEHLSTIYADREGTETDDAAIARSVGALLGRILARW